MKKIIFPVIVFFFALAIFSCDGNPYGDGIGADSRDGWLIMMYMGADSNLEGYMWNDLNEIECGLSKLDPSTREKVKFVMLWDGIEWEYQHAPEGAKLYELGMESGVVNSDLSTRTIDHTEEHKWWSGDEINTGDGYNVTQFMKWAKKNYPNYGNSMLIFSDHGGGPGGLYQNDKGPTRGAVWDDTNNEDFLETKEIERAISAAGFTGDNKLSILGFDACLMASIEEAYEHRTIANYYVASLEREPGGGWSYDDLIPRIKSNMTPEEFGTEIVKSYHDSFEEGKYHTLSCSNLSKIENLKTKIDALGEAILSSSSISTYKELFEGSQRFKGKWANLYEIQSVAKMMSTSGVSQKSVELTEAMEDLIVYSWAGKWSGNYYGKGHITGQGLSIMGEQHNFEYHTSLFDFADNNWAKIYNMWYPYKTQSEKSK